MWKHFSRPSNTRFPCSPSSFLLSPCICTGCPETLSSFLMLISSALVSVFLLRQTAMAEFHGCTLYQYIRPFVVSVVLWPCRRKWQPTPVFLPAEPHGQGNLGGYSPRDHKELNTAEWLSTWSSRCFSVGAKSYEERAVPADVLQTERERERTVFGGFLPQYGNEINHKGHVKF